MKRTRVRWARLAAMALITGLTVNMAVAAGAAGGPEPNAPRIYVVNPGDTIWAIARREAGPGGDPRPMVDRLIRVNHLRHALIVPGQRLVLSP